MRGQKIDWIHHHSSKYFHLYNNNNFLWGSKAVRSLARPFPVRNLWKAVPATLLCEAPVLLRVLSLLLGSMHGFSELPQKRYFLHPQAVVGQMWVLKMISSQAAATLLVVLQVCLKAYHVVHKTDAAS